MAVADLTRAQARARAELVTVRSYRVDLDFTCGDEVFATTCEIRFAAARPGAGTFVDLVAARIRRAELNGRPLDVSESGYSGGRLALPDLAADNVLTVVADFRYTNEGTGLHRTVDRTDGKVYLYTKFEPAHARRVYPNFEQPDLKAPFTFSVVAPDHWLVLSNEPAADRAELRPGVARWQFPATPPLSTYVTAVVAGDYCLVRESFTTRRGQVIPLGVACRASLAGFLGADEIFRTTRQGLDFFTGLFDLDFPFAKYDQVFVPEFSSGAMENAGCVTFAEEMLFRSKTTALRYEMRSNVILHEMAHMWFGDLVTMRWWGDLWLNESFADFSGTLANSEATRYTDAWALFASLRKAWGYMQDQLPSTHPVATDAPTLSAAQANFDGISYAKGASVLKQLVAYVGREAFFRGVREYFLAHAWGNAEFDDLLAALEQSSGKDLREWSVAWLRTTGPNTLHPEFELDDEGDGRFTRFAVRQEAPVGHPTLRPHHIAIGCYDLKDGALVRTHRVEVDVNGPRTDVPDLVGRPRPDVILLNDDDLGYTLTRFDPQSLDVLGEHIGTFEDPLARAVAWSSAIDMLQRAEMSVPTFFAMAINGMRSESSVSMLQTLHMATRGIGRQLADPAWLPAGLAELAGTGVEQLYAAEPGGDLQLAWAQLLTWTASTPDQLDLVEGLLERTTVLPGLAVDADLRWALLQRLAVTGRAGEERIAAELARDATDAGVRQAQRARAGLPDPRQKAVAWAQLTGGRQLGVAGILAVSGGFGEPEHAALLASYASEYFEFLPALWNGRNEHIRLLLANELFPATAAGPRLLDLCDTFLADEELDLSLRRVVVEGRDKVQRILRSRAL
ncbi:MAG TPA: aminopeptidase N [Actinocrinis sp.]|nr:aminopeptidase N [Actinocrinis sp.]